MICSVSNPNHSVHKKYQHLLLKRSDYPLSPIYSTKNLAKRISVDQERPDKVNLIGPEKDVAILNRITVKMDAFGELYRKVLEEVNELQEDLFGGIGFDDKQWFSFEEPAVLVDLVNFSHPGYCFGDEERNDLKKYEDLGLRALFHHPRLKGRYGYIVTSDKFIPNAVACHEFLRRASHARSKLATATHISVGGPARGPEFTAQFLRNHPQGNIRNVKIIEGDICLVAGYNKTSSMVSLFYSLLSPPPPLTADSQPRQVNRRRFSDFFPTVSTDPLSLIGSSSGLRRSFLQPCSASIQQLSKNSDSSSTLAAVECSIQTNYPSASNGTQHSTSTRRLAFRITETSNPPLSTNIRTQKVSPSTPRTPWKIFNKATRLPLHASTTCCRPKICITRSRR